MRKDSALSFRVPKKLKAELEQAALKEGRSVSQICEALLSGGVEAYKKQGSKYIQRLLSRGPECPQDPR
jgi:predicted HicB family RNase H-like nuclease